MLSKIISYKVISEKLRFNLDKTSKLNMALLANVIYILLNFIATLLTYDNSSCQQLYTLATVLHAHILHRYQSVMSKTINI